MNAKQDLTIRICHLFGDSIPVDDQRLSDIFLDYQIVYNNRLSEAGFQRQIEHFLFAKRAEGIADSTIKNYNLYLGIFNQHVAKDAKDVTTDDIRDFMAYLACVRHNKISSIQSVLNILRSFFGWLQVEELIDRNPTRRIKSFKLDKKDCRHPLTAEQMELIRNACQTYREKALVEFLYSTGCRISEATQINMDQLDMLQRTVSVVGKGNKRRALYFSIRARLMLQCYFAERKAGSALFCAQREPYQRLTGRAIQDIIYKLGVRAGITKRVHPHVFRHTLATDLLNAGMDITIIQQILGHNNVGTTQIYAENNPESVIREYRKYVA